MVKITRRDFLKTITVSLGAITLDQIITACQGNSPTPIPTEETTFQKLPARLPSTPEPMSSQIQPSPTHPLAREATRFQPTDSPQLEPSPTIDVHSESPTQIFTPAGLPDLVVARNGQPEDLVQRALAAIGGIERFVKPGANVIIKPNICVAYHTYEYAATTNPWVVGALVKLCFGAGAASVRVLDYPFGGTPQEAYSVSGIAEQVKSAGGEMVAMSGFKYVSTMVPKGKKMRQVDIFGDILKADAVIDVPIAKHHSSAVLTLGMKNLMGVVSNRGAMHQSLHQQIADLTSLIMPTLTVIDAIRILLRNGPTGGNLDDVKQLDTIIVSPDIVAADSYATGLFGLKPEDVGYIPAAVALGLGRSDLDNLRIEELNVSA